MDKKLNKDEALEYCFSQIKSSIIGSDDYNKLKQYIYRHRAGTLNAKGVKMLFEYFGVKENCYYTLPTPEEAT